MMNTRAPDGANKCSLSRSKHHELPRGSLSRIVWAAAAQVAGSPLRSPEEQGAQLVVSLRRGGEQPDGAGKGCQGQQQLKQGLLKFYLVSELKCMRGL